MKVTIVGGWDTSQRENRKWKLDLDRDKTEQLKRFCGQLGEALARKGHTVFVGSSDKRKSADYYVVMGMLRQLERQGGPDGSIHVIQGIDADNAPFAKEQNDARYKRFFRPHIVTSRSEELPRAAAKIASVLEADVVIAIAGLTDTFIAGIGALVAKKPLVPVGVFGGASRQLLDALRTLTRLDFPDRWSQLYGSPLDADFVNTVLRLGGLDRPRVFLGYCSKAKKTAALVKKYLRSELGLHVIDWATDFQSGNVILAQIQAAARSCKYGVFLFTPDDTVKEGRHTYKIPRANVVFEAGYFLNAHGPKRTLIIVQQGARVLADYGGYIYPSLKNGRDLSPIKEQLRQTFIEDLPKLSSRKAQSRE